MNKVEKELLTMKDVEKELYMRRWNDTGSGHWWHPEVESGDRRFDLETAIVKELGRRDMLIEEATSTLASLRATLGLDACANSELVEAVKNLRYPPAIAEAEVREEERGSGLAEKGVRFEGGKHICGNCDLPMTMTSNALGKERKVMCEGCGRTVLLPDLDLVEKAEKVIEEKGLADPRLSRHPAERVVEQWRRDEEEKVNKTEQGYVKQTVGEDWRPVTPAVAVEVLHDKVQFEKAAAAETDWVGRIRAFEKRQETLEQETVTALSLLTERFDGLYKEVEAVKATVERNRKGGDSTAGRVGTLDRYSKEHEEKLKKLAENAKNIEGAYADAVSHEQAIGVLMSIVSELLDKTGMQVAQRFWKVMKKWTA